MLAFTFSFLAWIGATAGPAFAGVLMIMLVGKFINSKYLAAFGLGIFLWFFVDTIQGSGDLEVNAGFTGGAAQVAMVALFAAGVLVFFFFDRGAVPQELNLENGLTISLLVAIALGIHGIGEGAAFGATAVTTPSTSLLDAFGGLTSGVAYSLHKALEPMMIGACYLVYSKGHAKGALGLVANAALLSVIFVVPSLIGAATGYLAPYPVSFLFALGTGTSVYVLVKLATPLRAVAGAQDSFETIKVALSLITGFILIYMAALLHA